MSGFSRVSIPPTLLKTINDIKEIAGKHSDEDVYAVLKDCNMDPNETAQKLLYLDTFHEVKRKRDRRIAICNSRGLEENRRIPGMQRLGTRDGNSYSHNSDEGVGGRQFSGHVQNRSSKTTRRDSKSFVKVLRKQRDTVPVVASTTAPPDGSKSICSESYGQRTLPLAEGKMRGLIEDGKADSDNKSKKLALRPLNLKQSLNLSPCPTPTSTPTNPSKVAEETRNQSSSLKRNSSSSASDPSLEPSLKPRNSCSVGIINNEAENQHNPAEYSADPLDDKRMNVVQDVTSGQAVSGSVDSTTNGDAREDYPLECPLEQTDSEIDVKLDKLHISSGQSVIFPTHLHVPEALKNGLIFGSLDVPVRLNNEESNPKEVPLPVNLEATKEPSPFHQYPSQASGGNDYPDVQSPAEAMVNLMESKQDVLPSNAMRHDQPKQEMLQQSNRKSLNPLSPSMPDYSPNLVPPAEGSHFVKLNEHEPQLTSKAGLTPSVAQPGAISQRSIPVSPPLFPLLRQMYPPNYMPYGPYISQLYMPPQSAHQLLTHSVFPHQPSSGNIYLPPTATATSGVKFSLCKPGNMAGNMTQFGVSSWYGSFGASAPGYGSGTGANGNSSITRSGPKSQDMYSMLKQNGDLQASGCVSGRGMSTLQTANVLYNLPQGHPVAYSPAQAGHSSFAGIYHHPSQSMSSAPSLVQSRATGRGVEGMIPFYPQPQGNTQQYGHTNWNQKRLNKENI